MHSTTRTFLTSTSATRNRRAVRQTDKDDHFLTWRFQHHCSISLRFESLRLKSLGKRYDGKLAVQLLLAPQRWCLERRSVQLPAYTSDAGHSTSLHGTTSRLRLRPRRSSPGPTIYPSRPTALTTSGPPRSYTAVLTMSRQCKTNVNLRSGRMVKASTISSDIRMRATLGADEEKTIKTGLDLSVSTHFRTQTSLVTLHCPHSV